MLRTSFLLLFLLILPACSSLSRIVTQTEVIESPIPDSLRQSCARYIPIEPAADGATVADLVSSRNGWRKAFRQCSADHNALIEATV